MPKASPPFVKTNLLVPVIPVGRQTLYFFPDRLLVFDRGSVGAVEYSDLRMEHRTVRFIESQTVPSDTQVVGSTWQYLNRNGTPDKRFSNNRQLPICLYEEVRFSSASGLNEIIQLSKSEAARPFLDAVAALRSAPAVRNAQASQPPGVRKL